MARKAEITVSARDKTKAAFSGALHNLANFVHVARGAIDVFKLFSKALYSGIQTAMGFEAAANPFQRFVGGADEARKHIKELADIGAMGVIPTQELIDASNALMQVSGGAMGSVADMKVLADAAATTTTPIGQLADSVGNFTQRLQAGDDITRAIRDLEGMGVVSNDAAAEIRALAGDAENSGAIFDILQGQINSFSGGVEDDAMLAASSVNRMKEQWRLALGDAGEAFLDLHTGAVGGLADKIQDLRDSGVIEEWAQKVASVINSVVKPAIDIVMNGINDVIEGIRRVSEWLGAFVAAKERGLSMRDASKEAGDMSKQIAEARKVEAARQKAIREERRKAREDERSKGFAAAPEVREKIVEMSAAAQKAKDEKKLDAERKKMLADQERRELALAKKTATERKRFLQDEAKTAEKMAAEAEKRADKFREMALNPQARQNARQQEREQEREERRFQNLLKRAEKGGTSPSVKAAVESMRAREEAKTQMERAAMLTDQANEAAIASEQHLSIIAENTKELAREE